MQGYLERLDATTHIFDWKLLIGGRSATPFPFTVSKNGYHNIQWKLVKDMTSWNIETNWEPGT